MFSLGRRNYRLWDFFGVNEFFWYHGISFSTLHFFVHRCQKWSSPFLDNRNMVNLIFSDSHVTFTCFHAHSFIISRPRVSITHYKTTEHLEFYFSTVISEFFIILYNILYYAQMYELVFRKMLHYPPKFLTQFTSTLERMQVCVISNNPASLLWTAVKDLTENSKVNFFHPVAHNLKTSYLRYI